MFNEEREGPPRPRAEEAPSAGQPEANEDAWARVLDCGAPGPAHEAPALFYQAGRAAGRAWIGDQDARAS